MADVRLRPAQGAEATMRSEIAQRSRSYSDEAAVLDARRSGLALIEENVRRRRFVQAEQDVPAQGHVSDVADGQAARIVAVRVADTPSGSIRPAVAVVETRSETGAVTSWDEADGRVRDRGHLAPVFSSGRAADPPVTCSSWQRRGAVVRELHDVEIGRAWIFAGPVVDHAPGRVEAWW